MYKHKNMADPLLFRPFYPYSTISPSSYPFFLNLPFFSHRFINLWHVFKFFVLTLKVLKFQGGFKFFKRSFRSSYNLVKKNYNVVLKFLKFKGSF